MSKLIGFASWITIAAAGVCVHAQTNLPERSVSVPQTKISEPAHWPKVQFNVLFHAKEPAAVPVTLSALQLAEDGTPQKIETIFGPDSPVSVCLEIDVSGSMTRLRKPIRDAVIPLIRSLPAGSEVMVSDFAEKVDLPVPFTPATAVDASFLDRIQFGHRTALRDAIVATQHSCALGAHFARRAFVLITDGVDNVSRHSIGDMIQALLGPEAPFPYILEIRDGYVSPAKKFASLDNYLSGTEAHVVISNPEAIGKSLTVIAQCIANQYTLTYFSPLTAADGRLHKVQVTMTQPDPRIRIEAMKGYYVPVS